MLARLDEGDFEVRQILIEHNLRLVAYIARRFDNTGINIEDLISIGTIGLIKAINTYRSDKNIKLATYASRCIENEILDVSAQKRQSEGGGQLRRAAQHGLGRQRAAALGYSRHGRRHGASPHRGRRRPRSC